MTEEITPADGLAAATVAFAKAKAGEPASPAETPPPETQPPAEPEPAPSPPPAEPPPAEPGGEEPPTPPAAAPPEPEPPAEEPSALDLSQLTPEAKRFLEMHGGDLNKMAEAGLRYNNRLAAAYREDPSRFQPGGDLDPNRFLDETEPVLFEDPQPEVPPLDVEVPVDAIQAEVDKRVHGNYQTVSLIQQFQQSQQQDAAFHQEQQQLEADIQYRERLLQDSKQMAADDLRRGEVENEINRLETKLGRVKQDRYMLNMQQQQLGAQFDAHQGQIRQEVESEMTGQAEEEALTQYEQVVEAQEYQRAKVEWPAALDRCMKENNIPPQMGDAFRKEAVTQFNAAMADEDRVIEDMYTFLAPVAKDFVGRMDEYHRYRSGQYATLAQQRAATPSPPTSPGTPAPPEAPQETDLDAIMEERRHVWKQNTTRPR